MIKRISRKVEDQFRISGYDIFINNIRGALLIGDLVTGKLVSTFTPNTVNDQECHSISYSVYGNEHFTHLYTGKDLLEMLQILNKLKSKDLK